MSEIDLQTELISVHVSPKGAKLVCYNSGMKAKIEIFRRAIVEESGNSHLMFETALKFARNCMQSVQL